MANERAQARKRLEPRMVLFTPPLNLPHYMQYSVLQRSRLRSASSDITNRGLNPTLAEKGVVAFGKSRS